MHPPRLPDYALLLVSAVAFVLSAFLSILLVALYPGYQNTPMFLTLQRPFTSWGDLRTMYRGLSGTPVLSPNNLTALVMSTAWCDHVYPRPGIVPANRSESCACLYTKAQAFARNNTWINATYTPAVCSAAADDAVSCLRYRPPWDVWLCGNDCKIHPIALALTCNLALTILTLAVLMGHFHLSTYAVWAACAVPTIVGGTLFLVIRPVQNFLFAMIAAGMWCAVALAGINEWARPVASPSPVRPVAIVACLWFCYPLTLAAVSVYLAVAHTVRDLIGVLCYAGLGYVAGLMAQRVYWARCYLVSGADAGGWPLPSRLAQALRTWVIRCLALGLAGLWVALFVLAYTNWLPSSPYAAAPVSLLLLLLCALMAALELAAAAFSPALGVIGGVGWLEAAQAATLLACHTVFACTALADGAA